MSEWPHYARPPVLEAVIELRLVEAMSDVAFEKVDLAFRKLKWRREEQVEFTLEVQPNSNPVGHVVSSGSRYSSPDAQRMVILAKNSLGVVMLPPYDGWTALVGDLFKYKARWQKASGKRALGRLGVRYINRLDIPCKRGESIDIREYFTFVATEPEILDEPVRQMVIAYNSGISADNIKVNLSMQVGDSPLIDHAAITLDIDLYREGVDVPHADNDISELLAVIRKRRTQIFEACITDKARKLIA